MLVGGFLQFSEKACVSLPALGDWAAIKHVFMQYIFRKKLRGFFSTATDSTIWKSHQKAYKDSTWFHIWNLSVALIPHKAMKKLFIKFMTAVILKYQVPTLNILW